MSQLLFLNVGENAAQFYSSSAAVNAQLQFFENFPGKDGAVFASFSASTLSVHAVNIPLSLSFNKPVVLLSQSGSGAIISRSISISFGLYSLNGGTLSLANSASGGVTISGANSSISWVSLVTSAAQNITPGAWYFAQIIGTSKGLGGGATLNFLGNSSINPGNAIPGLVQGRMTVSTGAMPGTIATSELDITGSDAIRQHYIILTA